VIPHGTTWGLMTPPGSSWEVQRAAGQHDPRRQKLIEVYSGHGNSEELRGWRASSGHAEAPVCPEPTLDYEPCCWRAGEIVRGRCEDPASPVCAARVRKARRDHVASGVAANRSIPGATVEDWGDCGQCRDCFLPAYEYRPGMSSQYALASGEFRFGLIGSSDTHAARAGNGFKEHARRELTEARAPIGAWARRLTADRREPSAESAPVMVSELPLAARRYVERGNSMLLSGGLAAVHAERRERGAIWDALQRREVYATSGSRILLWFDLLNAPGGPAPMGAEVSGMSESPRFQVRALGALEQVSGCPEAVNAALPPERVASLCLGECYHPGEQRIPITRVEIVRIRSGQKDLPLGARIEDPWEIMMCPGDGSGCLIEFEDPDFASADGETAYYARAIQEPTLAVNGGGLRCEGLDDAGSCATVDPCYGDERTPFEDDCLEQVEERAWSSPIFLAP
jgi:hypothetical protein